MNKVYNWKACTEPTSTQNLQKFHLSSGCNYCSTDFLPWNRACNKLMTAGFEIAVCQWPKAGHILEMAGENKTGLPKWKKNGKQNSIDEFDVSFFHLITITCKKQ